MARKILGKALMSLFVSKEGRDQYAKYKDAKARQTVAAKKRPAAPAPEPAARPRTVPEPVEPLADDIAEADVRQAINRAQAVLSGEAPPDIPISAPPSKRKAAELARALARAAASGTGQVNAHQAASLARKLSEGQAADEARPVPEFPSEVHIPTSSRPLTPERQELIRRALEVHRDKSKILDDLPQDVRDRLTALALRTFLHPPPPKKRQN